MLNLHSIAGLLNDDHTDPQQPPQPQQLQHDFPTTAQQPPLTTTPASDAMFGPLVAAAADAANSSLENYLLNNGSANVASAPLGHQPGDSLPCFKDLFAVLFECFTIISLGYLSCRFKLISSEAKDLSSYLTTFALPMIIFLNIAQMEFQTINLSFLFCMLIAKLSLFVVVSLLTLATSYPTNSAYAGALSILATQSNDFALGYPLIKSLYGDSKPEMLSYLSLMAPIQLLILNPLGIIMLEYEKSSRQSAAPSNAGRRQSSASSLAGEFRLCDHHRGPPSRPKSPPRPEPPASSSSTPMSQRERNNNEIIHVQQARAPLANDSHGHRRDATNNNDCCSVITMGDAPRAHQQRQQPQRSDVDQPNSRSDEQRDVARQLEPQNRSISAPNQLGAPTCAAATAAVRSEFEQSAAQRFGTGALTLVMPKTTNAEEATLRHRSSESSIGSFDFAPAKLDNNNHSPALNQNNDATTMAPKVRYQLNGEAARGLCKQQTTEPKLLPMGGPMVGFIEPQPSRTAHRLNSNASQMSRMSIRSTCSACARAARGPMISCDFLKALVTNPLIIASVVALTVNLVHGPKLPRLITKVSNTIAASFAAPALFVVGLSMHGKFELLVRSPNDLLLSSILVVTKVLILPSLMRTMAMLILPAHTPPDEIPLLTDFAFLYGLLPTAPTACIIAKQYEVLTNVVSISMLLSTFISAPLMLATSVLINQSSTIKPETVQGLIAQTMRVSGVMTLVLSLVTLCFIWKASKRISYINFINLPEIICRTVNKIRQKNSTHLFTFLLILTQLIIGIGGSMWLFVDIKKLGAPQQLAPVSTTATPISSLLYQRLHHPDHLSSLHDNSIASRLFDDANYLPNDIYDDDDDDDHLDEGAQMLSQQNNAGLDFMAAPTEVATRSFLKPHGLLIAPDLNSFGFNALCTMQYIFSSGGLIMAKFVILSIGLTIVVQLMRGHEAVNRLSSMMMRIYAVVGVGTVALSVIGSKHLKCTPSEASLPNWHVSLYLRLIYDFILVLLTVPVLSLMFRSENKANYMRQEALLLRQEQRDEEAEKNGANFVDGLEEDNFCRLGSAAHQLAKRKFLTSSASLSSDTSSALTTNTNLDSSSTPPVSLATQLSIQVDGIVSRKIQSNNEHQHRDKISTSSNVMIDCEEFDQEHCKTPDSSCHSGLEDNSRWFVNNNSKPKHLEIVDDGAGLAHGITQLPTRQSQQANTINPNDYLAYQYRYPIPFNKYSVLIVFMLIQVVLNLTTIIQMLNQEKPFGTFRQIEIANIALDFGQGLLTFLVVSSSWFPTKLISFSSSFCESRS